MDLFREGLSVRLYLAPSARGAGDERLGGPFVLPRGARTSAVFIVEYDAKIPRAFQPFSIQNVEPGKWLGPMSFAAARKLAAQNKWRLGTENNPLIRRAEIRTDARNSRKGDP
mgnify:CR=1 FL=1